MEWNNIETFSLINNLITHIRVYEYLLFDNVLIRLPLLEDNEYQNHFILTMEIGSCCLLGLQTLLTIRNQN